MNESVMYGAAKLRSEPLRQRVDPRVFSSHMTTVFRRHEPGDRQWQNGFDIFAVNVSDRADAALALDQQIHCLRNGFIIGSHRQQIVRIVRHARSNSTVFKSKVFNEADSRPATAIAIDQCNFQHVLRNIGYDLSVSDFWFCRELSCHDLPVNRFNYPQRLAFFRSRHGKVLRRKRIGAKLIHDRRHNTFQRSPTALGDNTAVDHCSQDIELLKIVHLNKIGCIAGREQTQRRACNATPD